MKDALAAALDANKAEDIVIVPLSGKSAIADYMIIASGRSARHVSGLAQIIAEQLDKLGFKKPRFEGKDNGDWVLADAGDVIVHIFRPEVRSFYNIEKIWCDPLEMLSQVAASKPKRSSVNA